MYAYIWRKLPFGLAGKLTGSIVLCTAIGVLLWYVAFPWATPLLPFDDVQVGSTSGQQNGPAQPGDQRQSRAGPRRGPVRHALERTRTEPQQVTPCASS
jgi:hypothetical protein